MKKTVTNGVKWSAGYEYRGGVGEHKTQDNMYDDNVRKLKFKFDIKELNRALQQVLDISDVDRTAQVCLTYSPNIPQHPDGRMYQGSGSLAYEYYATKEGIKSRLRDKQPPEFTFTEFVPEFKHTYFYEVFNELSTKYKLGRMRLMKLIPTKCYTWHMDPTEHIHIPIVTNPGNKLVIGDNTYFLPADGSTYITDTTRLHTAFNGGREDRFNLLINLLDGIESYEIEKERTIWCGNVDVIRNKFYEE
jgi:hypothetical protein